MRNTIRPWIQKILVSFFLSAGILALANVDTMMEERDHAQEFTRERVRRVKERLREKLLIKAPIKEGKGPELRESFTDDEFGESNPFAGLSTLDSLTSLFARGVSGFERSTYRSPDYHGESGYDLVHYEVKHPDGGVSTVLAFLDRPELTTPMGVGHVDNRVPVVMVMVQTGESTEYTLYRGGDLIESTHIPSSAIEGMVAQRIQASVLFLSVSR